MWGKGSASPVDQSAEVPEAKPASVVYAMSPDLGQPVAMRPEQQATRATEGDRYGVSFEPTLIPRDGQSTWIGQVTPCGPD